ncbi:MAG: alpha/beta fold hydrolase [Alphaproteobacteria bacterium]|nr:alpha/beta fold hydrolase [Alphaproteobacteria bacterium]
MAGGDITRRLAAILAADVVGYSKMMGLDEAGTLSALRDIWREHFNPCIAEHNGRIAKMMGDGALAEFSSVVDAVSCAVAFQRGMAARNDADGEAAAKSIEFRIGVNLGDIVVEDGDIFGDGVNVAARLEGLAPPGGVLTSDSVHAQIIGKVGVTFTDAGERQLKNIDRPMRCWQWDGKAAGAGSNTVSASAAIPVEQKIHFCVAPDGAQIAYATAGSGPPLVRAPHWMSHLEFDWQSPIWRHTLLELSREHTLYRFDQRANGLSDWEVEDVSFEAFVNDLAAVVDNAKLERFPLFGISQGCAISVAYAVRNPGRVSHLILYGGFARGGEKRGSPAAKDQAIAMRTLIRHGWGQDNPAFRQMFTSSFIPGGTPEQWDWFNELQRISVSPENAVRLRQANDNVDVTELLGQVNVPTLVLHCRGDGIVPFSEGRRMAAMIPDARFVALEGDNHLILEDEPAWPLFVEEIRNFLASVD